MDRPNSYLEITSALRLPEHDRASVTERYATDWLAGIRLLSRDINSSGYIRPETWQRFADEELSFVAEALPLRQESTFTLPVRGGTVRAIDGQPYLTMLDNDLCRKQALYEADERYEEQLVRSRYERRHGDLMSRMARHELGDTNVLITFSPYPEEIAQKYGSHFAQSLGYQPDRRLGFLWIDALDDNGDIEHTVVSLDNGTLSDFQRLIDMLDTGTSASLATTDEVVGTPIEMSLSSKLELIQIKQCIVEQYDALVSERLGQVTRAGRLDAGQEAWVFIQQQSDVLAWYFSEAENIARSSLEESMKKQAVIKLKQSLYAVLLQRYRQPTQDTQSYGTIAHEADAAYAYARDQHETLVGCGGQLTFDSLTPTATTASLEAVGKELWVWRKGVCRAPLCPSVPNTTEVGPCDVCRNCQKLFDRGDNIDAVKRENTRIRKHRRQIDEMVSYVAELLFSAKPRASHKSRMSSVTKQHNRS